MTRPSRSRSAVVDKAGQQVQGATLRARGLGVSRGGVTILSGVSLTFSPGRIAAVIGPSGSGKSTLLNCLGTLIKPSFGVVQADGVDLTSSRHADFRRELGFVPQDDVVHRELSVERELTYAARLRLDTGLSADELADRVTRVITGLGLAERRRHRIGRLSGGQRKRVNIAIELLADPKVVLLDEPASGLDPATEEDLLRLLRKLADQGRTVVLTTHSMEYLDQVDQVVVMMEGRAIFFGTMPALLTHFDIPHVAEMFKKIRSKPVTHWASLAQRGS